jgi:glutamine synthetase
MEATFMAKPYADFPGNGMHVHASVVDRYEKNLFDDGTDAPSDMLKNAVGGTLETMRDLQAIFAPHMNSYRRFKPLSFAPSAPDWGFDNRAAGVRLPETRGPGARLEHRIAGADVNPYLVITAILGGILHGLENKPALPLPLDDPHAKPAATLSANWPQTVERFENSAVAKDIFSQRFVEVYTAVRRNEISQLTHGISEVEYQTYLGRL